MYTFRHDSNGIKVISENGYEIPWGKKGSIPAEARNLCDLNEELAEDFSEWIYDLTPNERILEKNYFFNAEEESKNLAPPVAIFAMNELHCFSTYSAVNPIAMGIKKEEENMNTRFEDTQEGKAQAHVLKRANDAYYVKEHDLQHHYGLRGDDAPRSWNELVRRIKDGKFKISDEQAKITTYDPTCYIEWRDPKIEKDLEGFDKSMEKLKKLLAETKDVIIVKSAADGLEMIEKIENFKH